MSGKSFFQVLDPAGLTQSNYGFLDQQYCQTELIRDFRQVSLLILSELTQIH